MPLTSAPPSPSCSAQTVATVVQVATALPPVSAGDSSVRGTFKVPANSRILGIGKASRHFRKRLVDALGEHPDHIAVVEPEGDRLLDRGTDLFRHGGGIPIAR